LKGKISFTVKVAAAHTARNTTIGTQRVGCFHSATIMITLVVSMILVTMVKKFVAAWICGTYCRY
jgi:hypothetical protein